MSLQSQKIVVIGTGPSGLAAASRLFSSGATDVIVLEASDRIGGRINSVNFNGHDIELGAQFVHGEVDNAVFKIASKMGLLGDPRGYSLYDLPEIYATEDGEILDPEIADKMSRIIQKAKDAESGHIHFNPNESLGNYFDRIIDELTEHESASFKATMGLFKDHFHRSMQTHVSCDHWHMDSFDGTANKYQDCPGNLMITYKTDRKYADLLQNFTKDIPAKAVLFNSEVTRIEQLKNGSVGVEIRNGERRLTADYVIFTGSLGYLKDNSKRLFHPQLAPEKQEAIEKVGFGTVDKIFLEFSQRWWPLDTNGFGFLFPRRNNGGSNGNGYGRGEANSDWTGQIESLNRVDHRDNLLVAWIAGEGARKMETLSDQRILSDISGLLERFLRKGFPQMTRPVGIKVTRWYSNPYTRGSYTHLTVDSAKSGIRTTAPLAEPAFGGKLLFAGEATHHCYFSTVHGAIETGWREADRIVSACSKQQQQQRSRL